jgi:hypothetical protein
MGTCSEENTHHDNAPAHDALGVHEFLAKKCVTKMDSTPFSSGLSSCDVWHFPKLKNALKRQRFAGIPDIQCNMTLLQGIPKKLFSIMFDAVALRCTKCRASQGEYFKDDSSR